MNFNLSDTERSTLVNALYTANGRYRESAKEIAACDMAEAPKASVVRQFEQQMADCTALIEKLEV